MITEVTARDDYTGNGSTTAFTGNFKIDAASEVEVLSAGVTQTLNVHYTVSGVGNATHTVTFITAPASAVAVALIRKQALAQASDYVANETMPAARVETDLDKLVKMCQMFKEMFNRSLMFAKKSLLVAQTVDDIVVGKFARGKTGGGIDWATPTAAGALSSPVAIADGGTGNTTAGNARIALDVPGLQTENTFTKRQHYGKGADLASAATLTPSANGNYFHVTGTVTITAIASAIAGSVLVLRFAGILTLTHNATSLILSGAANITTAADDIAVFVSEGSGNWRCVSYEYAAGVVAVLRIDELSGLALANNASDATNDIDIAIGAAVSDDATLSNRVTMSLATALVKQLDAAWVVGTNQGMRDGGTIGNLSYHIYLIKRVDTGVVDVLASLNPGKTATITVTIASPGVVTWTDHGLQAGSSIVFTTTGALPTGLTAGTRYYVISTGLTTSAFQVSATEGGAAINTSGTQSGVHTGTTDPIMPTSYTKKRRIGSILRASAAIRAFHQYGDDFCLDTPVLDIDATAPGTAAVTRVLTVPIGVVMRALVQAVVYPGTTAQVMGYLSALTAADLAPSITVAPLSNFGVTGGDSTPNGTPVAVWTDSAAQIRSRLHASGAADVLRIVTLGWMDRRGRG